MYLYGNKKSKEVTGNNILSTQRPKDTILKTGYESSLGSQTRLKQKSIIKVYQDDTKSYIEHSTAYALGLIKTRAVMMDKPKLVELPSEIFNKLKNNDTIEIEYVIIEKKPVLKLYVEGPNYFIDNSAAYALGLLSVEEFNNPKSDYYYITKEKINSLSNMYDIEYHSLNLENNLGDNVSK